MTGVYSGWGAFLAPNIAALPSVHGKAETLSAWLGFSATLAGCVGGVACSVFADRFAGKNKRILAALTLLSVVSYLLFALVCARIIPQSEAALYVTAVLGGLFLNGTIPLFYEAACEATYPISEGSTTFLLTTLNNVGCLIFLFLPNVTALMNSPSWANWSLVAACVASFVLILPFKDKNRRMMVDGVGADPAIGSTSVNPA
jgi:FLVCR family MFS transporter